MKRKVYVPNKGTHDFTDALRFGDIVYITEGPQDKFDLVGYMEACIDKMSDATDEDYLVISSLPAFFGIAAIVMQEMFGRVNLLFFRGGRYHMRRIDISLRVRTIMEREKEQ